MIENAPLVTSVAVDQRNVALSTIIAAFTADPLVRWIFPQADVYLTHAAQVYDNFGGAAFAAGTAFEINNYAGVALWVPPSEDDHAEDDAVMSELLVQTVAAERMEEVGTVLGEMDAYHPTEPCWYLPLIGVDPCHQGRGLGAQLMKHALAKCDEAGLPAYLESSNPANISLYERHGFETMGKIQTATSPAVHPMYRAAR
ncbi:MAG: ribosomal protein S18 acetylase RimI-like enzyme [Candidatus Azotimanducaceae bacterium]|jgi:ribosomal protein S18 acetylase RimI-like enzyme|tara:strand:- start:833 stop:1432 length:600 start_codon:yes stop_codon:yes gene_type:complete